MKYIHKENNKVVTASVGTEKVTVTYENGFKKTITVNKFNKRFVEVK